ncbi:MAG: Phage polymerase-related protein, partial [Pedosphaera sp.]|nr:Phage polymerase-related protein [Pedosphaera sp.]
MVRDRRVENSGYAKLPPLSLLRVLPQRLYSCQDFPCTSRWLKYDESMSDAYHQLLDATIQHLEGLKARGVRFVPVQPASLAALAGAPPRSTPARTSVSGAPVPAAAPKPVERPKAPAVSLFSAPVEAAAAAIVPAAPVLSP